jgi:hypothetical protein
MQPEAELPEQAAQRLGPVVDAAVHHLALVPHRL